MQKSVIENYPAGVPHTVDPEQYRSVGQLLEESFQRHADQPFSVCMERWMSYRELDELSVQLGAWLQGRGLE
ncbi:MAG TPA: long-chain fatty acid--CoA ligase, partial [Variovorax sp.]|nr:long-chain fatty acid--CoA ligase [Variovorax sp.]